MKTSLAPGSRVVIDYLERAGLIAPLEELGFYLVGFGCTTCIGNSGPLNPGVTDAVQSGDLSVAAVLSGNRNFEGRIHPDVRINYLASPPLVVAYALAGSMAVDVATEPLGTGSDGNPVDPGGALALRTGDRRDDPVLARVRHVPRRYAAVFDGDERWRAIPVAEGQTFDWRPDSTYVLRPPFLDGMDGGAEPVTRHRGRRGSWRSSVTA